MHPEGVVPWRGRIGPMPTEGPSTGVYVIALTDAVESTTAALPDAPISVAAAQELIDARPECRLEGSRPSAAQIAARLAGFWFPDEVVLYIGCAPQRSTRPANGELGGRVSEYYRTKLGARSPHSGGWFLKTLTNLDALHVHYGYCRDVFAAEEAMLERFVARVGPGSRAALHDSINVMPFANLEYPKKVYKQHGIEKARAPRTKRAR